MRDWGDSGEKCVVEVDVMGETVEGGGAEGAEGWEMLFCPVMTVPSARPAEMWCEKLELMAGITLTCIISILPDHPSSQKIRKELTFAGTPVIAPNR